MGYLDSLKKRETELIFISAPAGLGHLRVMDALSEGLPEDAPYTIVSSEEKAVLSLHHFMTTNPVGRFFYKKGQSGVSEDLFTYLYRRHLHKNTETLYQEIVDIIKKNSTVKKVLVVATHFGLSHKLDVIKERIEKEMNVKLTFVIQVTDDSPQQIWYVPNADLIFVPSEQTREALTKYGQKAGFKPVKMLVNPYPISSNLGQQLSEEAFQKRANQLSPDHPEATNVLIPISGAAAGIPFFTEFVTEFPKDSRFKIHFVVRKSVYSMSLLSILEVKDNVEVMTFDTYRRAIDGYEVQYQTNVVALELTKPSEQAFKALLDPTQVGGSVLLFTKPVGKQEFDNLKFLTRHGLIPDRETKRALWGAAERGEKIAESILQNATGWRGLKLPDNPKQAADFIRWAFDQKLFFKMLEYRKSKNPSPELSSDGVKLFWEKVDDFLGQL